MTLAVAILATAVPAALALVGIHSSRAVRELRTELQHRDNVDALREKLDFDHVAKARHPAGVRRLGHASTVLPLPHLAWCGCVVITAGRNREDCPMHGLPS